MTGTLGGFRFLSQLYANDHLKSFHDIQMEFGIPSHRFYQYLHHTLSVQFMESYFRLIAVPFRDQFTHTTDKTTFTLGLPGRSWSI